MEFKDSKKFIEMLQNTRAFVEMGLSIDKNPPKDVKTFLEVLNELQSAAERVVNENDWVKFFLEYNEDIGVVLSFVKAIPPRSNKRSLKK
jgi:hypothetical protein